MIKKLFGGIDLSWPKLIIGAIVAGIITALIALIPALQLKEIHTKLLKK